MFMQLNKYIQNLDQVFKKKYVTSIRNYTISINKVQFELLPSVLQYFFSL